MVKTSVMSGGAGMGDAVIAAPTFCNAVATWLSQSFRVTVPLTV
jgi:hypothetical protein